MVIANVDIIVRNGRKSGPRKLHIRVGIARTLGALATSVWPRGQEASIR